MNYIYLANNHVGLEILQWLVAQGYPPSGLVVHPSDRSKYRQEIIAASNLSSDHILDAPQLRKPLGLEWLKAHQPDWLLSIYFGYILKPDVLIVPKYGVLNLHPSLLPYNKGAYPNVWSIIDQTPAGVTLHFVNEGVDTGDIVAQKELQVLPTDTGESLYKRLEVASTELFVETWPQILTRTFRRQKQTQQGTSHRVANIDEVDRLLPDQVMRVDELVNRLRARTFPPYKGAYLDLGDRRVYLRLELFED